MKRITLLLLLFVFSYTASSAPMTKDKFIERGYSCANGYTIETRLIPQKISNFHRSLDYSLAHNLITQAAYDWGMENDYSPFIDGFDGSIRAVCPMLIIQQFDDNVSGSAGSQQYFKAVVPENTRSLLVELNGGNVAGEDADLYLASGQKPDPIINDCASENNYSNERCLIHYPTPGVWHIMVYGYNRFNDVRLTISK